MVDELKEKIVLSITNNKRFLDTVNVDIYACIHFREFNKIANFAGIYKQIFNIIASMCSCLAHV